MNAANAAPITAAQDPATGAGRETTTAALSARADLERAIDTTQPAAPPDVRGDLTEDAIAAALGSAPMAVVVTVITADRITQRAHLHMGGIQSAAMDWHRVGPSSWRTNDREFIESEDRLGPALAEYMEGLDLPSKVANMLPRRPADTSSEAFRQAMAAAEELRHG